MTRLVLLIISLNLATPSIAQDSLLVTLPHRAMRVPIDNTAADDDEPEEKGIQFEAHALLSNIYESNIDHSSEAIPSVGLVPALHLRLRDRPNDTRLTFDYTLAQHSYSNTDRWDRTSHLFSLAYEIEPANDLASITEAEFSFRGSSEDRDLANQYQIRQTVEAKLSNRHRVEAYATLRYKTVAGVPDDNAFKPNVGVAYQLRGARGFRWEIGVRSETNRESIERGNYNRTTFSTEFRIPVLASTDYVELQVRRRYKNYTRRFTEDANGDDTAQLRQDRKWTVGLSWHHTLTSHVDVAFGVEVERRTSNDPDKPYTASALLIALVYRF